MLLCFLITPLALLGHAYVPQYGERFPSDKNRYGNIIGIDLGTTYSRVSVMLNDTVKIIANDQGSLITPSYVAFNDEGRMVGDAAKNQYATNPHRTIFNSKQVPRTVPFS